MFLWRRETEERRVQGARQARAGKGAPCMPRRSESQPRQSLLQRRHLVCHSDQALGWDTRSQARRAVREGGSGSSSTGLLRRRGEGSHGDRAPKQGRLLRFRCRDRLWSSHCGLHRWIGFDGRNSNPCLERLPIVLKRSTHWSGRHDEHAGRPLLEPACRPEAVRIEASRPPLLQVANSREVFQSVSTNQPCLDEAE